MKVATMIALVAALSMSSADAAEPATMGGKDMSMHKVDKTGKEGKAQKCEGMKAAGKSAQPGAGQGKGMDCPKDGMSDEHMKQMHDHMQQMHGDGGMMGKGDAGGMPMNAAAKSPAAKDAALAKPSAAAPADAVDHSAHHPK